jgi:WD40 repeat protein
MSQITRVGCALLWILATILSSSSAAPPVTALVLSPDGKFVVAGSQAGLRIYDRSNLKESRSLPTKLAHIHDLAFSPKGDSLAAAGGSPGEAGIVEVFMWPEGKLRFRSQLHTDLVYGIDWDADGTNLATAGYDQLVLIVEAASGKRLRQLKGHSRGVLDVCFLPDGKTLVSAGADQSVRVWETATGRAVRSLDNHTAPVHELALRSGDPDAPPMVASISEDRTVRFWQPTLGRMVRFARFKAQPVAAQWTRDGKSLVVAFADRSVRRIDPDTARVVSEVSTGAERPYSLAVDEKPLLRALLGDSRGAIFAASLPR